MNASNAHYVRQYAACIQKWREETGDHESTDAEVMQQIQAEILRRDPQFFERLRAKVARIHQQGSQASNEMFQRTQRMYQDAGDSFRANMRDSNNYHQQTMDYVSDMQSKYMRDQEDYQNPYTGNVYRLPYGSPGSYYNSSNGQGFYHSPGGQMYQVGPYGTTTPMNPYYAW